MDISKEDSVLDLGCGEGSITIPLSNIANNITAIDSSKNMLKILKEKCEKKDISNIETIEEKLEEVTLEQVDKHDIVLLSRSINGIYEIKETLENINKIANKYVYITIFGPNNWKFEKDFYKIINKENDFAPYNYLFNILIDMGIYPNVENLNIKTTRKYKSIEDAMKNGKWNVDNFTDHEKQQLYDYLDKNLIKNEKGQLENPNDKSDWVLIWWRK